MGPGERGDLCYTAAENGHIHILDWIHQRCPVVYSSFDAAQWNVWLAAAVTGHIHVLEQFFNNGFTNSIHAAHGAAMTGNINILLWTQEHSLGWDAGTCAFATLGGHLDASRWLWENGCPWGWHTIYNAQLYSHLEVVQWARDNGCPWQCPCTNLCLMTSLRMSHFCHACELVCNNNFSYLQNKCDSKCCS